MKPTQHHQLRSSLPPSKPPPVVPTAALEQSGAIDAHSNALLAEALNGLVKRVRQLEHDNARLKKRQRKHREALRELRSGSKQASDRCRPPPSPVVVDHVVLQHFPFLWDYDLRGRPFVGADPRYHPPQW
jgi:hypothetical protein